MMVKGHRATVSDQEPPALACPQPSSGSAHPAGQKRPATRLMASAAGPPSCLHWSQWIIQAFYIGAPCMHASCGAGPYLWRSRTARRVVRLALPTSAGLAASAAASACLPGCAAQTMVMGGSWGGGPLSPMSTASCLMPAARPALGPCIALGLLLLALLDPAGCCCTWPSCPCPLLSACQTGLQRLTCLGAWARRLSKGWEKVHSRGKLGRVGLGACPPPA